MLDHSDGIGYNNNNNNNNIIIVYARATMLFASHTLNGCPENIPKQPTIL